MVGGFVPSNINQELFFKYVKTSHFPCQFLYYLENTSHFNLLSPQTCAFGLKFQRSLLDNFLYNYELESIIATWNEYVND